MPVERSSSGSATSRHSVLAAAFEVLGRGLGPFVDGCMSAYFADEVDWPTAAANRMGRAVDHEATDPLFQLLVLRRFWGPAFSPHFGEDVRGSIVELLEARNRWAHLNLPEDVDYLERCLLAMERILAPVSPESVGQLRALRAALRAESYDPTGQPTVDLSVLETQLSEAEAAFAQLQDRYGQVADQLERSRRAAATKQLRLSAAEHRLAEARGRSQELESVIDAERQTLNRIEWLFVGFIAVMLMVMVLLAG
jgi:hypothetical protein